MLKERVKIIIFDFWSVIGDKPVIFALLVASSTYTLQGGQEVHKAYQIRLHIIRKDRNLHNQIWETPDWKGILSYKENMEIRHFLSYSTIIY